MKTSIPRALAAAAFLLGATPAFAQGVYQTPPAPNASQSSPQPPDSAPKSARTLPSGSTGTQRAGGTIATTRVGPATVRAVAAKPAP